MGHGKRKRHYSRLREGQRPTRGVWGEITEVYPGDRRLNVSRNPPNKTILDESV